MAQKTYKSKQSRFSTYHFDAKGKKVPIQFAPHFHGAPHGEFTTSDEETQKFIESRDAFLSGHISIKTDAEIAADKSKQDAHVTSGSADRVKHQKVQEARVKAQSEQQATDKVVQRKNVEAETAKEAVKAQHLGGVTERKNIEAGTTGKAKAAATETAPSVPEVPVVESQEKAA